MPPVVCGIPRPPNPSPAGGAPLVTKLLLLSGAALNQVRKDRGPSYCKPRFQMWSVLGCYYRWTAVLLYRCRPIYEYEQDCYDLFLLYEVFFSSTRCCRHFAGLSAVPGTAVPGGTRQVIWHLVISTPARERACCSDDCTGDVINPIPTRYTRWDGVESTGPCRFSSFLDFSRALPFSVAVWTSVMGLSLIHI